MSNTEHPVWDILNKDKYVEDFYPKAEAMYDFIKCIVAMCGNITENENTVPVMKKFYNMWNEHEDETFWILRGLVNSGNTQSKPSIDSLNKESVREDSNSDTVKTYNSVSTASNELTISETGLFISFYNEDEQGNEHDTVTVHLSAQKAQSLVDQLQSYLNDKRNKVYHNKSAEMDLFSDNDKEQTNLTKEHGHLVEYGKIYTAKREADGVEVKGHRVFTKQGISKAAFEGLLSLDKVVLWSVTWDSLREVIV